MSIERFFKTGAPSLLRAAACSYGMNWAIQGVPGEIDEIVQRPTEPSEPDIASKPESLPQVSFTRPTVVVEDEDHVLAEGSVVCACGSWNAWEHMDEMVRNPYTGEFETFVVLGETRCEYFFLCVLPDGEKNRIVPVADKAGPSIRASGPGRDNTNYMWMIDGRDEEVSAGTVYKVRFKWTEGKKTIQWHTVDACFAGDVMPFDHTYSVMGSWSRFEFEDLEQDEDEDGAWEGTFKIGLSGEERFQFARDHDRKQLVYPARQDATDTSIPVRGPDDMGHGRYWHVHGSAGSEVKLRLSIVDAHVELIVSSGNEENVWQSVEGWARHNYFLRASWSDEEFIPLRDFFEDLPIGYLKCSGEMRSSYSWEDSGCIEHFQVCVDEDVNQVMYPEDNNSGPAESRMCGPDGSANSNQWLIKGVWPGDRFEVHVVLAEKRVTWWWTSQKSIEEDQITQMQEQTGTD